MCGDVMKKKRNVIFLVLMLLLGIVGTTYAYFTKSETFDNVFSIDNFNVVIEENFEEGAILESESSVSKEVFVANKENVPAIVRLSYNESIISCELYDNVYKDLTSNLYYDSYYISKIWTQNFLDNWYFYEGWYYYLKVLPALETVQILDSISYENYGPCGTYNLDYNIEAVQATSDAVKELWNQDVVINDDGTVYWGFRK